MKTGKLFSLITWLVLLLFSVGLRAQAPAEPTVHQIYQAASNGDLRGAQAMVDQVLSRHPDSARAHYVKAELAAREQDAATARAELQAAQRLAPGLPFVRPEAVAALRAQLDGLAAAPATLGAAGDSPPAGTRSMGGAPGPGPASGPGLPVGGLLIAAVVAGGVFLMVRRRRSRSSAGSAGMGRAQGGPGAGPLAAQQRRGFDPYPPHGYEPGMGPMGQAGPMGPMGQAPQGSMGGSLMRGLGTGLAVGAGALAAQEIGRRMLDHGREATPGGDAAGAGHAADSQIARDAGLGALSDPLANRDLGGEDFGIAGGGWDDGGGFDPGDLGGGDWDN